MSRIIFKDLVSSIISNKDISDSEKISLIKNLIDVKEFPGEFEKFWITYKSHITIKSFPKKEAYKRFNNVSASVGDPKKILIGLNNYLKECQQKQTDPKYIIGPRRFLTEKIFLNYQNVKKSKDTYICSYGNEHKIGEPCNCF